MAQLLDTPDRGLNQYWYSAATLAAVVQRVVQVVEGVERAEKPHLQSTGQAARTPPPVVALIGAPSVFYALPAAVASRALLLEYDARFEASASAKGSFAFFDYRAPFVPAEHCRHSCALALCDPPFLSKDAIDGFCGAAAQLLCPDGEMLYASVPENLDAVTTIAARHGIVRAGGPTLRVLPFVPLQVGIAHRFRFFSTVDGSTGPLEAVNKDDESAVASKEPEAVPAMDDIDLLFDGLKGAVISALTDDDGS